MPVNSRKLSGWLAMLLLAAHVSAAEPWLDAPPAQDPAPWTHKPFNDSADSFHFAIVGDRTGGMRPGVFEQCLERAELLQPAFVLCIGDLAEGNVSTETGLEAQHAEVDAALDRLSMPFFRVTGNHDIANTPFGKDVWLKRYGRLYYHFVYKDVLFLCLSTDEGGSRAISDEQVAYVQRALDENPNPRWTFVFMHHPLWTYPDPNNWDKIEAALGARPHTVFAGHTHEYLKHVRNSRDYIVLATSGGGTGAHEGPIAGEFDHITWVSVSRGEPHIVNLMLEGLVDKDIRTTDSAALLEPLLNGAAVSMSALEVPPHGFLGGQADIIVRNPGPAPLEISGVFEPTSQLKAAPSRVSLTLPPKSEQKLTAAIEAVSPLGLADLQPLTAHWRLTYAESPAGPRTVQYTARICPEGEFVCGLRYAPPRIDGALDDWRGAPYRCLTPAQVLPNEFHWDGAGDCSFSFWVERDENFLYIAGEVIDDTPFGGPERNLWRQDGVQLRIDARPDPERSAGRGEEDRAQTRHLLVAFCPMEDPLAPLVFEDNGLPEGIQLACARTAEGFNFECALSLSYIRDKQNGAAEAFRLNVTAADYDSERDPGSLLWWRPAWYRNENIPGSGTFRLLPPSKL